MPVLLDRLEQGLRRPVARLLRNQADLHRRSPTAGPRERASGRKTCRARITRLTIYRRRPLGTAEGHGSSWLGYYARAEGREPADDPGGGGDHGGGRGGPGPCPR